MTGGYRPARFVLSTPVARAAAVLLVLAAMASAAPALAAPDPASATGGCFVHSLPAAHADVIEVQWAVQASAPPLSTPPAFPPFSSTLMLPALSIVTAPGTPPPRMNL